MTIDEILNKNPPSILYHYTSQEGLLGIVGNKEIWATKAHFLNDSREFMYAIDLLMEVLETSGYQSTKDNAIEKLKSRINGIKGVNICVASFTKDGDSLGQWRGYGNQGAGYSIGLRGDMLKKLATAQKFILCPVVYNKDEQVSLIKEIINRWISGEHQFDGLNPMNEDEIAQFEDYFAMLAPILKDASFKAEQEWRLISPMLDCDLDRYSFRAGRYSLIPYYRFSLEEPTVNFEVEKVRVGPSPLQELARMSAESFLVSKNLDATVITSSIPYRGW